MYCGTRTTTYSKEMTMANDITWTNYHSPNPNKGTNEEVQSMIRDVVETIHKLEKIYGVAGSRLVVRALLQDWLSLSDIAKARNISYEHP